VTLGTMRRQWRGAVVPVTLLVLAEIYCVATNLQSDSLARPSDIAIAAVQALIDGEILRSTAQTLWAAAAGLGIGLGIGLSIGILLGLFAIFNDLMDFSIEAFRPIPSVALIPVAMLLMGFGYGMEISIVAFATTWPILILTRSAISGIEPRLIEVARALRFGLLARIWKIVLPAALPRIFVALRLAIGIALVVAVTVEISANPLGLGYAMMSAQQSLHPDLMFALLFWTGFVGWVLNAGLFQLERRFFGSAAVKAAVEVVP
jgi:ABC-type nitrate/sulfonate/bicarbonate transport system permease component